MQEESAPQQNEIQLEQGTYEILRNRLLRSGDELRNRLDRLNSNRKDVFGAIETKLIATERVTTENNCIAWDMFALGEQFLFGYNVHLGLRSEIEIADVFSIYSFQNHSFQRIQVDFLNDETFISDFKNLYRYYKETQFVKFANVGPNLYMIFRIGKSVNDIKAFKWVVEDEVLHYIDARSEHEFKFPSQHGFEWKRTSRDQHVEGKNPHISIEDRVFVECIGGDLTLKIENNTDTGEGLYAEEVDNHDQTLDDAEIYYSIVGNVVLLKIRPYQERAFRYLVYNSKVNEVKRIDAIADCCILLPDDHGLIFPNGYYLQTGEYKLFEIQLDSMLFEKQIASPNGEDFLFVFFNKQEGMYLLLSYNLIEQTVSTPISCHGYSIFENGELCYFKADTEAKKHHAVQIWQTPYVGSNFEIPDASDSILYKIGNKDIVRAMAECNEILTLINKDDSYDNLYFDILKEATDVLDSYYWLQEKDAETLAESLQEIKQAASAAIDEFEKVVQLKKNAKESIREVEDNTEELLLKIRREPAKDIDQFVHYLSRLRTVRGEVISLKDVRYVDTDYIDTKEKELSEKNDDLSKACVDFLEKKEALQPYREKVKEIGDSINGLQKVIDANKVDEQINQTSQELEMLIEIVSNLKIEDATQTTAIIDAISEIYASFNQIKSGLKRKRKELFSIEGKAEFGAQLKLINQGVLNYLDICDTPEKCEEYLSKLMVQLEELEGKFSEFDEFVEEVSVKREEIYNAFESKKVQIIESRNKRANTLMGAADRILKAAGSRVARLETVTDINGYFASDLMIEKARDIIGELIDLGDSVKADDIQNRLKVIQDEATRQLKDKSELFVGDKNVIQFGKYQFLVNSQKLGLSMVQRDGEQFYHLTGTSFFEQVDDEELNSYKTFWNQSLVSENEHIYRGEFLAYQFLIEINKEDRAEEFLKKTRDELLNDIRSYMAPRYNEAYVKGVHDHDAATILYELLQIQHTADLLIYSSEARACAAIFWNFFIDKKQKELFNKQLKSAGIILQVFPKAREFDFLLKEITVELEAFVKDTALFDSLVVEQASKYLFKEMMRSDDFIISQRASEIYTAFHEFLDEKKYKADFDNSLKELASNYIEQVRLTFKWLVSFCDSRGLNNVPVEEITSIIVRGAFNKNMIVKADLTVKAENLLGSHSAIQDQNYEIDFNTFSRKLEQYFKTGVPAFTRLQALKKQLLLNFESDLRLKEFEPKVMSSFVRNQLIDEVYFPLIGANLAKQIGTTGDSKRTDLMGMLLLISPPGYGKTTLMEYLANRLGIIFMKINGPAIGHHVTSVDPNEAPNATAREELEKLNLAFEMGDNVMIYLDDIQHCNPEFLQKFISLCDAQRKIEGVYKGQTKTYDFRGKKVCVVMAGNPYTESGDKFQIPDMLANRADIYNLGDILGDSRDAFEMSYIENSLTSNSILSKLAKKSHHDVLALTKIAKTNERTGVDFEVNHSGIEVEEYLNVLKKVIVVRDVVLKVNQEYIKSAGQEEEYRTEPPFKLQGSYRNMNKLVEKIAPVMNEEELSTLILSHYEQESQTLTTGAEANLLKFKELIGVLTEDEKKRWVDIKATFVKNNKHKALGGSEIASVLSQLETLGNGLSGIRDVLSDYRNNKSDFSTQNSDESWTMSLINLVDKIGENQSKIASELARQQTFDMSQVKQEALVELRKEIERGERNKLIKKARQENESKLDQLRSWVMVTVVSKDFLQESNQSYISFEFAIENQREENVTFIAGTLDFRDEYDESIHKIDLIYDQIIESGSTALYEAQIIYNQYLEKDVLLKELKLEEMNTVWLPREIK